MKVAMCIKLKEQMGVSNIHAREEEILSIIWNKIEPLNNVHILAKEHKKRLGIVSFYIDGLHYNVAVKMLNDRFGIQTRGGCSCAGTYGHYLLDVSQESSKDMANKIRFGDCSTRPGWIRMSIHPTTTDKEVEQLINGITELALNHKDWIKDYEIDYAKGIIQHKDKLKDSSLKLKMDHLLESAFD